MTCRHGNDKGCRKCRRYERAMKAAERKRKEAHNDKA